MAGLFDFGNFDFGGILKGATVDAFTAPWETAKDLVEDPKGALGKHQDRMTEHLGNYGLNEDNPMVKNSDAIAGSIVGAIFAAPAMAGGAGAAGAGGAGGGTAAASGMGGLGASGAGSIMGGGATSAGMGGLGTSATMGAGTTSSAGIGSLGASGAGTVSSAAPAASSAGGMGNLLSNDNMKYYNMANQQLQQKKQSEAQLRQAAMQRAGNMADASKYAQEGSEYQNPYQRRGLLS